MADYLVTDTELTNVASAIRIKNGINTNLTWPAGYITAIENISTLIAETTDANATSNDILNGKTAYVKGNKIVGSITSKNQQTYIPTTSDQIIEAGQFLTGNQTIKAIPYAETSNLSDGYTAIIGG